MAALLRGIAKVGQATKSFLSEQAQRLSDSMTNEDRKDKLIDIFELSYSQRNRIPLFISKCTTQILIHSDVEGLFRISPDMDTLKNLKIELEDTGQINHIEQLDIHQLTALLKHFYRQLRPTLINPVAARTMREQKANVQVARQIISKLATPYRENLIFILKFLQKVSQSSASNLMNVRNLAIVFAPNLIDDYELKDEDVIEFLIRQIDVISGE